MRFFTGLCEFTELVNKFIKTNYNIFNSLLSGVSYCSYAVFN